METGLILAGGWIIGLFFAWALVSVGSSLDEYDFPKGYEEDEHEKA